MAVCFVCTREWLCKEAVAKESIADRMKLPTVAALTQYVIYFAVFDLLYFFYAGYPGKSLPCCARVSFAMPCFFLFLFSSSFSWLRWRVKGFGSNVPGIVTVFSWLCGKVPLFLQQHIRGMLMAFVFLFAAAMLFVSLTMVVNAYLIRRELLVYFLSLYVRLFALAFQMIALGIGITHSSTFSAVVTYVDLWFDWWLWGKHVWRSHFCPDM